MDSEFDRLVLEHTPQLLRAAYLPTGRQQDAEDLVQETWLTVHRRWLLVRASNNRRAYVRRILTNRFLPEKRRKQPSTVGLEDANVADPSPPIDDQIAQRERVAHALARLSARERAVIVSKYYLSMDTSEIARAMGCRVKRPERCVQGAATLRSLLSQHSSSHETLELTWKMCVEATTSNGSWRRCPPP